MWQALRKARDWIADHPDLPADIFGVAALFATSWLIFVIAACL